MAEAGYNRHFMLAALCTVGYCNMRVVKLSSEEFQSPNNVRRFFVQELSRRTPPGKFRVTPGRIARKDGLRRGEFLLFTHKAQIVFTACANSGLVDNLNDTDDMREKYPCYFIVDLGTLQEAEVRLDEFENWYRNLSGKHDKLVRSQGWNRLDDSVHTDALWKRLRKDQNFR
jgi:hypothetical protein